MNAPKQPVVRAVRTLDCARRARIHYVLPTPLVEAFAADFPEGLVETRVDRFSHLVVGAKDLVTVTSSQPSFCASGALGGCELTVTYGKVGGDWPATAVRLVEAVLTNVYGSVEHVESSPFTGAPTSLNA